MATFLDRIALVQDALPSEPGVLLWAYDQARDEPWICMGLFTLSQAAKLHDKLASAWAIDSFLVPVHKYTVLPTAPAPRLQDTTTMPQLWHQYEEMHRDFQIRVGHVHQLLTDLWTRLDGQIDPSWPSDCVSFFTQAEEAEEEEEVEVVEDLPQTDWETVEPEPRQDDEQECAEQHDGGDVDDDAAGTTNARPCRAENTTQIGDQPALESSTETTTGDAHPRLHHHPAPHPHPHHHRRSSEPVHPEKTADAAQPSRDDLPAGWELWMPPADDSGETEGHNSTEATRDEAEEAAADSKEAGENLVRGGQAAETHLLQPEVAEEARCPIPPTEQQEEVQPTEQQEEVQPTEQQEEVQPTEQQEEFQPTEQQEEVQPMEQQEEVQPTEQQEEVQPTEQQEEVQPTEPQPTEQEEVQPTEQQEEEVQPTETQPTEQEEETQPGYQPMEEESQPTEKEEETQPTEKEEEAQPTKQQEEEAQPTEQQALAEHVDAVGAQAVEAYDPPVGASAGSDVDAETAAPETSAAASVSTTATSPPRRSPQSPIRGSAPNPLLFQQKKKKKNRKN